MRLTSPIRFSDLGIGCAFRLIYYNKRGYRMPFSAKRLWKKYELEWGANNRFLKVNIYKSAVLLGGPLRGKIVEVSKDAFVDYIEIH